MTAMMACGMAVQAQTTLTKQQAALVEMVKKQSMTVNRAFSMKVNKLKKTAEEQRLYLPKTVSVYDYDNGVWNEEGRAEYSYDTKGSVTSVVTNYGIEQERATYTYNADGNLTEQLVQESLDGGQTWLNEDRIVVEYDAVLTSQPVRYEEQTWDEATSAWTLDDGSCYKYDITRDAQGRVTQVLLSTVPDGGRAYVDYSRDSYTYGSDGKITASTSESFEDGVWSTTYSFSNMQWYATDNQPTGSFDTWCEGNNVVKSADVSVSGLPGTLVNTLQDDGSYTLDIDLGIMLVSLKKTVTDQFGSSVMEMAMYMDYTGSGNYNDNNLMTYMKEEIKFDSHGNMLLDELWANAYGTVEQLDGVKTDYSYNPENDAVSEIVDYDWDSSTGYVPETKLVTEEYTYVLSSGINAPESTADNAPTAVYSLAGVKVGTSLSGLPTGIYIVKKGAKAVKVIKTK